MISLGHEGIRFFYLLPNSKLKTQNSTTNQVVGEPVDTAFYSPDNPALAVPSSTPHPLAELLPPEALRPAAADGRPFVLLSIFKVRSCH